MTITADGRAPSAFDVAVDLYVEGAGIETIGPYLREAQMELEVLTQAAVDRAVGRETWATIGTALGVSRQAAAKRFGA